MKYNDVINKNLSKDQANNMIKVFNMLKLNDYVKKQDIMRELKMAERTARLYVTAIKYLQPIISTSSSVNRGFKLAKTEEDTNELQHSINDDLSRVKEILNTTLAKFKFMEKHGIEYSVYKDVKQILEKLNADRKTQYKIKD